MTQIKLIIYGLIALAIVIIAGLIYWRGSSNATTRSDLHVARETIQTERETLKVTNTIDMRVNAEYTQTVHTAQGATREIERIRTDPARAPAPVVDPAVDPAAARVVQLAREARAAALASSARLQPTRAGAR
jgi:uncharacterized protein YxeA